MRSFFLLLTSLVSLQVLNAQVTATTNAVKLDTAWTYGGGLGLDLGGLAIIHPKVGGGTSRLGLGGLGSVLANRKGEKSFWNNQLSLQLSVQRLGRTSVNQPEGFQKNLDVLRLASTYGYKIGSEKWYISADLLAQTQLLKTYKSNYLKPVPIQVDSDYVVSKLFSPALLQFSPGVTYKPNSHLNFQYSPVSVRYIFVADEGLAALNIHGNDPGKKYFLGLGSELVSRYANKYFKDHIAVTSALRLFSNYLDGPQNIDVLFANNFSIQIFKGLSLDLLGELFYDQNVKMTLDENDNNIIGDPGDRQAPATQLTGAFMLKYSVIF